MLGGGAFIDVAAIFDATHSDAVYTAEVTGTSFVVSWEGISGRDGLEVGHGFQVILYANGNVEMRWGERHLPGATDDPVPFNSRWAGQLWYRR